jgi:hypothetical protein
MPACMTELLTAHARGDPASSLAGRGSGAGLQGVIGRDGEAGPMGFYQAWEAPQCGHSTVVLTAAANT